MKHNLDSLVPLGNMLAQESAVLWSSAGYPEVQIDGLSEADVAEWAALERSVCAAEKVCLDVLAVEGWLSDQSPWTIGQAVAGRVSTDAALGPRKRQSEANSVADIAAFSKVGAASLYAMADSRAIHPEAINPNSSAENDSDNRADSVGLQQNTLNRGFQRARIHPAQGEENSRSVTTPADEQNTAANATHCRPTPPYQAPLPRGDLLQAYPFSDRDNSSVSATFPKDRQPRTETGTSAPATEPVLKPTANHQTTSAVPTIASPVAPSSSLPTLQALPTAAETSRELGRSLESVSEQAAVRSPQPSPQPSPAKGFAALAQWINTQSDAAAQTDWQTLANSQMSQVKQQNKPQPEQKSPQRAGQKFGVRANQSANSPVPFSPDIALTEVASVPSTIEGNLPAVSPQGSLSSPSPISAGSSPVEIAFPTPLVISPTESFSLISDTSLNADTVVDMLADPLYERFSAEIDQEYRRFYGDV